MGGWQDVRLTARSVARRPFFAVVAMGTIGLGIAAATTLFSVAYAVLWQELPYQDADRVLVVTQWKPETGEAGVGLSAANARDLSELTARLGPVSVAEPYSLDLQLDGRAESLRAWSVSSGFFEAVGSPVQLGRTFLPSEYAGDSEAVAILAHATWVQRFGAEPSMVGRTVTLDDHPVRIVGILHAWFDLPSPAEIWIPRPAQDYDEAQRAADYMTGYARLAPGATLEEARAEAEGIAASLAEEYPGTNAGLSFRMVPLREDLVGDARTPLLVLLGAVAGLLLIACANVAGLQLARGADREHEYALRAALGAGRARLLRYAALEGMHISVGGALLGIALTFGGIRAIRLLAPAELPRIDEVEVGGPVLAFALLVTVASAALSGLLPSLRMSRADLRGFATRGERGGGRRKAPLRHRLVVGEVATAVVLLVGAGLLLRSFTALLEQDLGFDPQDLLAVQVFAYGFDHPAQFMVEVQDRMAAIPGVEKVAVTSTIPGATDGTLSSIDIDLPVRVANQPDPPTGQEPRAYSIQVSPGYFDVMGIRRVSGRDFADSDDARSPSVAVVNEAFVRRFMPEGEPLGQRVTVGAGARAREWEVVGVVADVRPNGHESMPRPEVYRSLSQAWTGSLTFVLQSSLEDAAALTAPAREAVWSVNSGQSVWGAATVEDLLAYWLQQREFSLVLLGAFSLLALCLAAVGIYGVVSYSVEQRVAELGIRKALGGQNSVILAMVFREGAVLAGTGAGIGVVGSLALTPVIRTMLFGVTPTDPLTFLAISGAILAVATLATLRPAIRALRLDPREALGRH